MSCARSQATQDQSVRHRLGTSLAVLTGALPASVARADWGDNWGTMLWGFQMPEVPLTNIWGLLLLSFALAGAAMFIVARRRGPRVALVASVLLALPLTAYAATISLPNVFTNGTPADATEVNDNFSVLADEVNAHDTRLLGLESGGGHTHPGSDITSQVGDADTVDGAHAVDLEESLEIDADIIIHGGDPSAHHSRYQDLEAVLAMGGESNTNSLNHSKYTDADAFTAVTAVDGAGSTLDADLLDGMQASELISAAADEVRTPISSAPIAIATSGSYYFTGNLDGSSGGIDITANDVTLDLMGFTLDGTGSTDHGIDLSGSAGVTIRNGRVRGFGLAGIYQDTTTADFNRVHDVQVLGNGVFGSDPQHSGIYLAGSYNHVVECTAGNNGGYGIFTGAGSHLASNTGAGISDAGCPSVPFGCPASHALRTPGTVATDVQTAINAQDWSAVACNYAEDAIDIHDQGNSKGHSEIIAVEQSLSSLFNGVPPTLSQQDVYEDTVRVLDSLDNGWVLMPDRTRTYVVECGLITRTTSHGLIEFTGPPP